jgi:hypothetical protein
MNKKQTEIIRKAVENSFAEIETQLKKSKKFAEAMDTATAYIEYQKALKSWIDRGEPGDRPQMENFAGTWEKSMATAKQNFYNPVSPFEALVKEGLKGFKIA